MEKKKQTRKELEREIKILDILLIFYIGLFVITLFIMIYNVDKKHEALEENEMLKEQIQTYTITVECTYPDAYSFVKYNVTDYQDYVEELELIKQDKNCEVVE